MTVKECYEMAGADFNDIMNRLGSEALVKRFAVKLLQASSDLTEKLRSGELEGSKPLYEAVSEQYKKVIEAVTQLAAE